MAIKKVKYKVGDVWHNANEDMSYKVDKIGLETVSFTSLDGNKRLYIATTAGLGVEWELTFEMGENDG